MTRALHKRPIHPMHSDFSARGVCALLCTLACLALLVAGSTTAQTPLPRLTLDQALQAALKQHPSLQRTDAQTTVLGARVRQAQSGRMPSLVLQGAASDGPLGAPAFGPLGNPALNGTPPLNLQGLAGDPVKKQFGGSMTVTLPLFDFGRTQHLVAARRGQVQAAEEDAETQKALVLLGVQQAYLNVLRAQQLSAVQKENLQQRETTVRQAKLFVEGQLKAGVDLQLSQANASEANVALIAAQNDVRFAFAVLNNAMGETTLAEYQLDNASVPPVGAISARPLLSIDEAVKRALARRPELKSMALQRQAADQSVHSIQSELLPRFDAIASVGVLNPSGVIQNSQDYAVGVAVSIPLYTGGAVEGRIAEEKQKREVVIAQEREAVEFIKLQVSRAWLDVQTREAQVTAAQEQVTSANSSLQLASERYRLQLNTLVELTDAEALAIRAHALLVNSRYDLEIAHSTLDWAMGETYQRYLRPVTRPKGGRK
jgi:outer membrane protein